MADDPGAAGAADAFAARTGDRAAAAAAAAPPFVVPAPAALTFGDFIGERTTAGEVARP